MEQHSLTERKIEQKTLTHKWQSCCLETDKQAVVYIGQLTFSFSVLIFCCSMLVLADGDCNKSSPYTQRTHPDLVFTRKIIE